LCRVMVRSSPRRSVTTRSTVPSCCASMGAARPFVEMDTGCKRGRREWKSRGSTKMW
jgi:hypothetical protein